MNIDTLAKIFGVVFLLIGILGFVPGITSDGHLLGIFEVDMFHNIIHLLTGIIALVAAVKGASRLFFKVFGVIYALVAVLGFVMGGSILGLFSVNTADNALHVVIALIALYAGFGMKGGGIAPSGSMGGSASGGNHIQPAENTTPPSQGM